jgi:hypothetical protein
LCLSLDDRRELVRQLLAAKQDPELHSLQPVGWCLSHMRSDISLSASDIEIFDGYFCELWQVALVLLPDAEGAARAGFFAREAGGKLQAGSSYQEFTIAPPAVRPRKARHLRWLWAIPTLLVMVLAGVLIKPPQSDPVNPGIFLRIQGDGPALQINWDANSVAVRGAKCAEIEVQDGSKTSHFQLAVAQLGSGQMSWQCRTGEVRVRMIVYPTSGAAVREFARNVVSIVRPPARIPQPDTHAGELKKLNDETSAV